MKNLLLIVLFVPFYVDAASPFTSSYVNTTDKEIVISADATDIINGFFKEKEREATKLKGEICDDDICKERIDKCTNLFSYEDDAKDEIKKKKDELLRNCFLIVREDFNENYKNWSFFKFQNGSQGEGGNKTDSVIGGIDGLVSGDSLQIKFNFINYNFWLGGDLYIPFQIFLGTTASSGENIKKENNTALLDPESGVAINVPLLIVYQPNKKGSISGLCDFRKIRNTRGNCTLGGDITMNFQELESEQDTGKETVFGSAIRLGAGMLFPVVTPLALDGSAEEVGYLSMGYRFTGAYSNSDDVSQVFSPIVDANGNRVNIKDWTVSSELTIKFAINDNFSISGKYIIPHNNDDYFDDEFSLVLGSAFK